MPTNPTLTPRASLYPPPPPSPCPLPHRPCRRHRYVNLSFLGIFNFTAPYLPWVLLAFSVMLGSSPAVDLMGMAAGHAYFFLEDVYPQMTGRRPLRTPAAVRALFAGAEGIQNIQRVAPPLAAGQRQGVGQGVGLGQEAGWGEQQEAGWGEQQEAAAGHPAGARRDGGGGGAGEGDGGAAAAAVGGGARPHED
jgi:Derlin-2/3